MAKLLVIEDDELARSMIENRLTDAGYKDLIFSDNGEDGVSKAISETPDLVLTDTVLPGISGFEVCRKIKEAIGNGIKVIMMTGSIDAVDAVKARRMGADDYVVKSADPTSMIEAIRRLI